MIVLASTSPTRQAMLRNAGLAITAVSPQVDERRLVSLNSQWMPSEIAPRLAEAKAVEVSTRHVQATVIGADQVLALGSRIFSKPRDIDECRDHLRALRGETHKLISGVACARNGKIIWTHTAEASLTMRNFSESFLDFYLETVGSDCMSSVGGYKIEGAGVQLFEEIKGDHFTILGLPLLALLEYLRHSGQIIA